MRERAEQWLAEIAVYGNGQTTEDKMAADVLALTKALEVALELIELDRKPALVDGAETSTEGAVWLVERGQPENQYPTVWLKEVSSSGQGQAKWTENAWEAIRYHSQGAARCVIIAYFAHPTRPATARAVEHFFSARAALSDGAER